MLNIVNNIKRRFCIFFLFFLVTSIGFAIQFKNYSIISEKRLKLTREYCKIHYGLNSHKLIDPQMIVIHYTVIPDIEAVLKTFRPERISPGREYIKKFGDVNVGVHFVVDRNGDIYSLLPEDVIGRHTIGFNHVSFGIENVARNQEELTEQQLTMNARLVFYLTQKYPAIKYLVGHFEYMNSRLPHFVLYRELNKNYNPTKKQDPGREFMMRLRTLLKEKHRIELMD